ncbi:GAF domain-containing protein [Tateyamaria omphalii]|uniref:histidine kinase dimerization/phosphoacceptor domain -containing protein n=1 Tax=Tateyamaria omphalii TaxID=299262 RepID=UPI001C997E19|nr:histidine kinase dimerization/phosphoacceptor domain -containing protein [Tateyamaria omphalii]MBY5935433.1 GAF domain-containing protein [Tateyamaria omphalii]
MLADRHPFQDARLEALRSYDVLDTEYEPAFDSIVDVVADICDVPIALISLVDDHRQWFKAVKGLDVPETPLESSICSHAILEGDLVEIEDTHADPRMDGNPLCVDDPGLRFYAGAVLKGTDGLPLGTLCVLDHRPRRLTEVQRKMLKVLAGQVMAQFELHRTLKQQAILHSEADHRIKNSLQMLSSLTRFQSRVSELDETREALDAVGQRIETMGRLHEVLQAGQVQTHVDLDDYLIRIIDFLTEQAPEHVLIDTALSHLRMTPSRAASIGIVLNEWVTNAYKHAFPNEKPGTIRVTVTDMGSGTAQLEVADDGCGTSAEKPVRRSGLGTQITDAVAQALDGTLTADANARGTRHRLLFAI